MENLINAINAEYQKRMIDFNNQIENETNFGNWYYTDLLPKSKKIGDFETTKAIKEYLKQRKQKQLQKQLHKELQRIETVFASSDFESCIITIEWKKSNTWGSNPKAEAKVYSPSLNIYDSGSISGCGYDKESTAFAYSVNQSNSFLKLLYQLKNNNINIPNRDLFGYGSGYNLLPYLEGGVGVSCFYHIFDKLGFILEHTANGKTFDVYKIYKK